MAFKLTYSDGQETEYDDDTAWVVDDGVLKMGRQEGEWSVLVSPSHWAVIEVGAQHGRSDDEAQDDAKDDAKDDDQDKGDDEDKGDEDD